MTATLHESAVLAERASRDERVNILLVDDRAENLLALEAILEPLGERTVRAHSGDEALKCLLTEDFAVILLDVQMPGMDGFETASYVRQRERSRHTPIIFLTAHDRSEAAIVRGYTSGAVDFLFKPIPPQILQYKVAAFVELFQKTEEVKRQGRQLVLAQQSEAEQKLINTKRHSQKLGREMHMFKGDCVRPVESLNSFFCRTSSLHRSTIACRLRICPDQYVLASVSSQTRTRCISPSASASATCTISWNLTSRVRNSRSASTLSIRAYPLIHPPRGRATEYC